ncbi:MAG: flagellar FliJ family protein [Eubacteriales bacterium]|nr:flagellar FliJ family protein [Eubacteriales bacterium]
MKQFVFTKQKYYQIRADEYDRLKTTIKAMDEQIRQAQEQLNALQRRFDEERDQFHKDTENWQSAVKLREYQWFFPYIREQIQESKNKLAALERQREKLQNSAIRLFKELGVLDDMRDREYEEYRREVALEEAKDIDTHLSYMIYKEE